LATAARREPADHGCHHIVTSRVVTRSRTRRDWFDCASRHRLAVSRRRVRLRSSQPGHGSTRFGTSPTDPPRS